VAVFVVRKKSGDRFIYKCSRVQKWQMFSESDRRGLSNSACPIPQLFTTFMFWLAALSKPHTSKKVLDAFRKELFFLTKFHKDIVKSR